MSIPFSIIVAVDKNFGIGKNGVLPWTLPGEIKHFKEVTTRDYNGRTNVVIMGRKTWESLPSSFRPLPKRINVVLTREDKTSLPLDVLKCSSLDNAFQLIEKGPLQNQVGKVFVIGGAELFKKAIAFDTCREIFLTKLDQEFICDTFFPSLPASFVCVEQSSRYIEKDISYLFERYQR